MQADVKLLRMVMLVIKLGLIFFGVGGGGGKIKKASFRKEAFGDPGGARTLDPLIKSQLLYQLSYGVMMFIRFRIASAKLRQFLKPAKKNLRFFQKKCIFCRFP